jgi:hypothetical protein
MGREARTERGRDLLRDDVVGLAEQVRRSECPTTTYVHPSSRSISPATSPGERPRRFRVEVLCGDVDPGVLELPRDRGIEGNGGATATSAQSSVARVDFKSCANASASAGPLFIFQFPR